MTRTVSFFLTSIEKRQTLIVSLATLKTENSRLKETISTKTEQVNEMMQQLESLSQVERNLRDLITRLFAKLEAVKKTYQRIHEVLLRQQVKASGVRTQLESMSDCLQAKIQEKEALKTKRTEIGEAMEKQRKNMTDGEEQGKRAETEQSSCNGLSRIVGSLSADIEKYKTSMKEAETLLSQLTERVDTTGMDGKIVLLCREGYGKRRHKAPEDEGCVGISEKGVGGERGGEETYSRRRKEGGIETSHERGDGR